MRRVLRAALIAGTLSGVPSTLHAVATGRDPLEASKAAGTILRAGAASDTELLATGIATHAAISLAWTAALTPMLPRRPPIAAGALAGALIALVDLGWAARHRPRIAALPRLPQLADHVAFGMLVAAVVASDGRTERPSSERRRGAP